MVRDYETTTNIGVGGEDWHSEFEENCGKQFKERMREITPYHLIISLKFVLRLPSVYVLVIAKIRKMQSNFAFVVIPYNKLVTGIPLFLNTLMHSIVNNRCIQLYKIENN